jgi:formylmethanofuran:tetrahydromethanopterin formyltransferase
MDKEDLKEIVINGVKEDFIYGKLKAALQSILERASN